MSPLGRRSTQRTLHLLLSVGLGAFVYSPLRTAPAAVLAVQTVLFPLLVLSGALMWTGPALRQRFRGRT
ncbi:hypothetical protein [Haloarcula rara]|uniref:hypothetical protein n=1 Tax=Haloarcula rara TaxID=3033387 RepID=UPI0023E89522|nr:hypothetical protein [Halomicroarcula sp. SHR3]